jgi:ADP-ribose pyrophosphatase YjhB (NUDIX family)
MRPNYFQYTQPNKFMPHIHEKIDFTVEVFIVHKDKVLLRKHDKYKIWLSVGGHIELDEDPNQAALREVREEVGLNVKITDGRLFHSDTGKYKELIAPRFLNRHYINDNHEHVTMIYFAISDTDKIKASDDEKSEESKWFTAKELNDPKYDLKENIRFYASKALEELAAK